MILQINISNGILDLVTGILAKISLGIGIWTKFRLGTGIWYSASRPSKLDSLSLQMSRRVCLRDFGPILIKQDRGAV